MNKAMLDYKNTMAMLAIFGLKAVFTDAMLISKLRQTGSFLGLRTGAWKAMYSTASLAFMMLTLYHLIYRKDKIMLIKECLRHKTAWH